MSISKSNLRLIVSLVSSGTHSTNSKIINWFCATFLAGLFLLGGSAKAAFTPYNALVNPGAETGDLTGWNVSNTGYTLVVSTNSLVPGTTTENYLAHSGQYTFEQFDITADSAYIWQDYPAVAGSQWSASVWAICYASNYFDSAIAYMEVAFFDTNNNLLGASFDSNVGSCPPPFQQYGYGVYGSAILDPYAALILGGPNWIIAPPPAVDASGWMFLPATNFYYGYTNFGPTDVPIEPGFCGFGAIENGYQLPTATTNLVAPPGTAFVRYKLEFDNGSTDGGAVYWDDCVLEKLTQSDPDITKPQPASVIIYAGDPASFTVNATVAKKGEILTYQWQNNGTNLPAFPGGDIAGSSTNATLQFTNCQASDMGLYACWVSDTNGSIRSVPVTLTVLPFLSTPLCDPGFEAAPSWGCWNIFNGAYLVSATNTYPGSTNTVNIFDGNWCAEVGANGDRDNGFYQVIPGITPGTYWGAGGWAYISSINDFAGGNTCRLQVWFADSSGNPVPGTPIYESFKIYGLAYTNADMQYTNIDTSSPYYGQVMYHDQLPRDQWVYLAVTNMVNNGGIGLGDDLPTNTLFDGVFMVPTNTTPAVAEIHYQVYEYCPQSFDTGRAGGYLGNATDAVYWDDMVLTQVPPETNVPPRTNINFTISVSGTNVNLSFNVEYGFYYTVLYKTNLTDATWSILVSQPIPLVNAANGSYGSYNRVTVTDPIAAQSRFYQVQLWKGGPPIEPLIKSSGTRNAVK